MGLCKRDFDVVILEVKPNSVFFSVINDLLRQVLFQLNW